MPSPDGAWNPRARPSWPLYRPGPIGPINFVRAISPSSGPRRPNAPAVWETTAEGWVTCGREPPRISFADMPVRDAGGEGWGVHDRDERLHWARAHEWDVREVVSWCEWQPGLADCAAAFRSAQIDGDALLRLSASSVAGTLGLYDDDACLRICAALLPLRRRWRSARMQLGLERIELREHDGYDEDVHSREYAHAHEYGGGSWPDHYDDDDRPLLGRGRLNGGRELAPRRRRLVGTLDVLLGGAPPPLPVGVDAAYVSLQLGGHRHLIPSRELWRTDPYGSGADEWRCAFRLLVDEDAAECSLCVALVGWEVASGEEVEVDSFEVALPRRRGLMTRVLTSPVVAELCWQREPWRVGGDGWLDAAAGAGADDGEEWRWREEGEESWGARAWESGYDYEYDGAREEAPEPEYYMLTYT